jgi:hypothetical protein
VYTHFALLDQVTKIGREKGDPGSNPIFSAKGFDIPRYRSIQFGSDRAAGKDLAHVGILRSALWRLFPKALDLQQAFTSHKRSVAIPSCDDRSVIELSCRGDGAPNAAVMTRPIYCPSGTSG